MAYETVAKVTAAQVAADISGLVRIAKVTAALSGAAKVTAA